MPPLISEVELQPRNRPNEPPSLSDEVLEKGKKLWYHRLPLGVTIGLILAPQPSVLWMLVNHHHKVLQRTGLALIHCLVIEALTFMIFSSLMICVSRDPGPVNVDNYDALPNQDEDIGVMDALNQPEDDDVFKPGRWCRKCWAPKPERTHHCSMCGRCVLKMDHHCPWLGNSCIGHRTYPAFVHFLTCISILALYIAAVAIDAIVYSFSNPYVVDEITPVHELVLAAYGLIFAMVITPFAGYHFYLISTNQTTLENISPFMLLKYLPPLPRSGHSLSDPPLEPELSFQQRRLVKDAHGQVFLYDVGWRQNWAQVFGWDTSFGWVTRLWCGGASPGDGRQFPRNPKSDAMLERLARELVKADRNM